MNVFLKQPSESHEPDLGRSETERLHFADDIESNSLASELNQADVDTVVEKLKDRRSRVQNGFTYWAWRVSTPILALSFLYCLPFIQNGSTPWALSFLFALSTIRAMGRLSESFRMERAALQNSHLGKEWIGALCEALEWPEKQVQGSAALLLTEFLPRLTEEDAKLLNEEQLTCLYRRLSPLKAAENPELASVILRVLPFVGTEDALSYVERLASLPSITQKGRRLRSGARAVHALLERRVLVQRADKSERQSSNPAVLEMSANQEEYECTEQERTELSKVTANLDKELAEFEAELKKLQVPGMRFGFLIATWCVVFPYGAFQTVFQFLNGNWIGGSIFAILTVLSTQFHRLTLMGQHTLLARRLAKIEDVRCIGRLAEVLEWPDSTVQQVAISSLSRLLPQVKASDRVLQTARQRANLHRMLTLPNARRHAGFLVNLLKALEQIGDESAMPYVQQLAKAIPTSTQQRRVCDAARECLPYLELRADLNRNSQTLLRASSAFSVGEDMLVRPASASGATDREQLLRPGSSGGDV